MKILELCLFSAGGDGVFARVKMESSLLAEKGHEIRIFSSNIEKGSGKIVSSEDKLGNVLIKRFPARKIGGESYMTWNKNNKLVEAIVDYGPDVIIAHSYRHTHTIIASRIARKIGAKVFLVTHAPFARSQTRSLLAKLYVNFFHDPLVGRRTLKKFDKIIAITKWEMPYLKELGVPNTKIEYVPNGITEEFFGKKMAKEQIRIVYLGRISQIKNLETAIKAIALIKDKKIKFEIYGSAEPSYLEKLKSLILTLNLQYRVSIIDKFYDKKEEIKKLDSSLIYLLPSISEGMPQTLIEALARQKIVIASDNNGNKDLVENGKNGFLFEVGNEKALADKINFVLSLNKKGIDRIKKSALQSVKQFAWKKLIEKLEKVISA